MTWGPLTARERDVLVCRCVDDLRADEGGVPESMAAEETHMTEDPDAEHDVLETDLANFEWPRRIVAWTGRPDADDPEGADDADADG